MTTGDPSKVLIVGAGPVGLVAAAWLLQRGISVTVFETLSEANRESRASTFHPPTLDMLDDLGVADSLIAEGLIAPTVQYRLKKDVCLGTFNFADISDLTRHPYRLQCEQFRLTRIILERLREHPLFRIHFNAKCVGVSQHSRGVEVHLETPTPAVDCGGGWLIGADGARSLVRRSMGISFDGFTWPERFLVVTTPFDFDRLVPNLSSVTYISDPAGWSFLLRIKGAWRVMVPIGPEVSDDEATSRDYALGAMTAVAEDTSVLEIQHTTLYRVHQRVASTFRKGRIFLAGDAAHVNNPLGGMGMNGGIHDAINLANALNSVIQGGASDELLDLYDRQRRTITLEAIQTASIRNKRNLEAKTEADRIAFRREMDEAMRSREKGRDLLMRLSMIASLQRAAALS